MSIVLIKSPRDGSFSGNAKPRKKHKYNAKTAFRCESCFLALSIAEVDNDKPCPACRSLDRLHFHSSDEARRFDQLKRDETLGLIRDLELQPAYPIEVNGGHICDVILDFRYVTNTGTLTIEDVKGKDTRESRIKRKLVEAVYRIKVHIIKMRENTRCRTRSPKSSPSQPKSPATNSMAATRQTTSSKSPSRGSSSPRRRKSPRATRA